MVISSFKDITLQLFFFLQNHSFTTPNLSAGIVNRPPSNTIHFNNFMYRYFYALYSGNLTKVDVILLPSDVWKTVMLPAEPLNQFHNSGKVNLFPVT